MVNPADHSLSDRKSSLYSFNNLHAFAKLHPAIARLNPGFPHLFNLPGVYLLFDNVSFLAFDPSLKSVLLQPSQSGLFQVHVLDGSNLVDLSSDDPLFA